jgi:hypothetical protein
MAILVFNPGSHSARPMGNVVANDGSLLFTDDRNGVIYRVSYVGGGTAPSAGRPIAIGDRDPAVAMDGWPARHTELRHSDGGPGYQSDSLPVIHWVVWNIPAGDEHHYHIELFALDQKLTLQVGSNRGGG